MWELWLDQPLDIGQRTVVEYELDLRDGAAPSTSCLRRFAHPVRQYVLEIAFAPGRLPGRCETFDDAGRRPLALTAAGVARTVLLDIAAGSYGIAWEWPGD